MKNRIVVILLFLVCAALAPAQKVTAVRFGKLWDGEKVIDRAVVVVENGRIRSVSSGDLQTPAGAELVDWSRYYGIPGRIDVHTHMPYYWDRTPGPLPRGQQRMPAVTV